MGQRWAVSSLLLAVTTAESNLPQTIELPIMYFDMKAQHPDMELCQLANLQQGNVYGNTNKYGNCNIAGNPSDPYLPVPPNTSNILPDVRKTQGDDYGGNAQRQGCLTQGLVEPDLGPDGLPVCKGYNNTDYDDTVDTFDVRGYPNYPLYYPLTTCANFDTWWRETAESTQSIPGNGDGLLGTRVVESTITFKLISTTDGVGTYQYDSNDDGGFFPLDRFHEPQTWGPTVASDTCNSGSINTRNFHFCSKLSTIFTYRSGTFFSFGGDDDVWVFINKKLAVDLGGLHTAAESGSYYLDDHSDYLEIEVGYPYPLDVFQCERQTTDSNYKVTTTLEFASPPASAPFPPPFPPMEYHPSRDYTGGHRDPHLLFAGGGKADFKGENHTWYNFLSAKNHSLNVLFEHDDFKNPHRVIHGSMMKEAVLVVRTAMTGRLITIEYNATASAPYVAAVREGSSVRLIRHSSRPLVIENVQIAIREKKAAAGGRWKSVHGETLVVNTGLWELSAMTMPFPNPKANPGKAMLNVRVEALYDADHDPVAPHGLVGQSYDGDRIAVSGAVDNYKMVPEMTTHAMAEGALEGEPKDYEMTSKFSTEFKFSRFDKSHAKPRDVASLSGKKTAIAEEGSIVAGHRVSGAMPDVAEDDEELVAPVA